MIRLLRYKDLRARGFVKNRVQLGRLINHYGFPPGRMISPNARAWNEDEIEDYGLPEYRNSEELSNPEAPMTACQIVAEETGMSESWVIKIWQDRKEMFTRVGGTHSPVE